MEYVDNLTLLIVIKIGYKVSTIDIAYVSEVQPRLCHLDQKVLSTEVTCVQPLGSNFIDHTQDTSTQDPVHRLVHAG